MSDQAPVENAEVRQRRVPDSPDSERLQAPGRNDVRPTSDESDMDAILQDEDRYDSQKLVHDFGKPFNFVLIFNMKKPGAQN
uniref:Uncharacterized protein n=1 Tax=Caenorhabditis japonica TaxID=281687 RepID=A0A8R1IV44_CAEJA